MRATLGLQKWVVGKLPNPSPKEMLLVAAHIIPRGEAFTRPGFPSAGLHPHPYRTRLFVLFLLRPL